MYVLPGIEGETNALDLLCACTQEVSDESTQSRCSFLNYSVLPCLGAAPSPPTAPTVFDNPIAVSAGAGVHTFILAVLRCSQFNLHGFLLNEDFMFPTRQTPPRERRVCCSLATDRDRARYTHPAGP